jgi:hypothetical protein
MIPVNPGELFAFKFRRGQIPAEGGRVHPRRRVHPVSPGLGHHDHRVGGRIFENFLKSENKNDC